MAKLIAGQHLYFVPTRRYVKPCMVTVESVGRKWAHISNRLRIDMHTLIADGGDYMSPGRCYSSEEEYNEIIEKRRLWIELTGIVQSRVKSDDIDRMALSDIADLINRVKEIGNVSI